MITTKPAYFIFDVNVHDPDALTPYQQKVEASYKAYGGRRRVMGGKLEVVEGTAPHGRLVMLEFPSLEQAHAWHDSAAYQDIIHYRHAAATTHAWLVEGVANEQP